MHQCFGPLIDLVLVRCLHQELGHVVDFFIRETEMIVVVYGLDDELLQVGSSRFVDGGGNFGSGVGEVEGFAG